MRLADQRLRAGALCLFDLAAHESSGGGAHHRADLGLTASLWTEDEEAGEKIGEQIDTGTFFLNRCDYLDPALAWTGVKDTGRGATLSRVGYEHLTRPKSYHLRTKTK